MNKKKNSQVFFMAVVSELRMELIFPRSTLARLTPRGLVGAVAEAEPALDAASEEGLLFNMFVGTVEAFEE